MTIILIHLVRDGIVNADATNNDNDLSFKYKASIIGNTGDNGTKDGVKTAVPLKYLSNFWKSFEMPLINCKLELSLNWTERCILTVANTATLKITDTKLYVPIVTLSAEDNVKLSKLLSKEFKRSVCSNKYKVVPNRIVEIAAQNAKYQIRELLDSIGKELKDCLFLLIIIIKKVIINFLLILIKNIFLQELK